MAPPGVWGLVDWTAAFKVTPNKRVLQATTTHPKKGHLEHPGVYYTYGYIELTLAFDDKGDERH